MKYVIQDLVSFGYWDNLEGRFRGILFATLFTKEQAEEKARSIGSNNKFVTIIPVYGK